MLSKASWNSSILCQMPKKFASWMLVFLSLALWPPSPCLLNFRIKRCIKRALAKLTFVVCTSWCKPELSTSTEQFCCRLSCSLCLLKTCLFWLRSILSHLLNSSWLNNFHLIWRPLESILNYLSSCHNDT